MSEVDWTGISDKAIKNTDDLVDTVKGATISWEPIGVIGRADPDNRSIKMMESLLFGPLELALPALAHEAHHVYLGSKTYYKAHKVDAERVGHWIQWEVWERLRPCGQGMPEDEWFFVNYADYGWPEEEYDDYEHFARAHTILLKGAYTRHNDSWYIAHNGLEYQRQKIKEWYGW